jgi:hypothetical protein
LDEYPSSSEQFEAYQVEKPDERVKTEEQEQTKVTSSIGIVKDVLDWLDKCAKDYDSVQSINYTDATDPNNVMAQVIAARQLHGQFTNKSAEFQRDFAQYLQDADEA